MGRAWVESVQVGKLDEIEVDGRLVRSGIRKRPVAGEVRVTRLGLVGDAQGDLRVHGGPHRAVYAYPIEHYDHWADVADGGSWGPGAVGENLTTRGLDEESVCIGDVLRVGTCLLQVSQPRAPCATLAARVGSREFPRLFSRSGRVGFYLRVLSEGFVRGGDVIETVQRGAGGLSVRACYRLRYFERDAAACERASANSALEPTWRAWFRDHA